ncbi:MAG: DUF1761 domain-containing protein [Gammaproteobacteria bacterium]|nr:DUF1761 domain-containing protein [Gammaproteobacteria bacterium]NNF61999.1 DUF1761 domain-containing protein [Gammaproteobacteria bacterium]
MPDINYFAVVAAAVSSFMLGGLWYSKLLFEKVWTREAGVDPQKGHAPTVFGVSFVFSLLAALAFAWWLGPKPELLDAVHHGLFIGTAFVATSFGINYQFAQNSMKMWAIDAGYHILQFGLFGLVLGLWH